MKINREIRTKPYRKTTIYQTFEWILRWYFEYKVLFESDPSDSKYISKTPKLKIKIW